MKKVDRAAFVSSLYNEFQGLYDEALKARHDAYWADPRVNSVGGVESPTDREQNEWALEAFEEASSKLDLHIEEARNTDDDCYHRTRWTAVHPDLGAVAALEYVDCVCGDHGPRNAELLRPQGQEGGPS